MKQISSTQNPYIKELIKLQEKSRERKKKGLFLVEGQREISLVIKGDYTIDTILFVADMCTDEKIASLKNHTPNCIEITKEVYQKIAYRDTTEGIIAVVKTKKFDINSIQLNTSTPLIVVMEGIEKPGNIGAMLRTADAAKVDAVFIDNLKKWNLYDSVWQAGAILYPARQAHQKLFLHVMAMANSASYFLGIDRNGATLSWTDGVSASGNDSWAVSTDFTSSFSYLKQGMSMGLVPLIPIGPGSMAQTACRLPPTVRTTPQCVTKACTDDISKNSKQNI